MKKGGVSGKKQKGKKDKKKEKTAKILDGRENKLKFGNMTLRNLKKMKK